MRLPRVFRTANFRLAVIYAALFSLSVLLLGLIVFLHVGSRLEEQLRQHIEAEMQQLLGDYRDDGLEELRHDIREHIKAHPVHRLLYFMQSPDGRVIFDALPSIPAPDGWHRLARETAGRDGTHILLYSRSLRGGYRMAVAGDLSAIRETKNAIRNAFGWAFLLALLAGGGGGLWISRRFLSQVDAITQTAERIGSGDLAGRLPLGETGDDLDHLALVLNRMLDRIQHLVESVRQVSTNIAHDLRTPLGRLRQTLESLRQEAEPSGPTVARIDEALEQLDGLLDTFSALLRIAEVESGTRRDGFTSVCLSELMETIAAIYRPVAEENRQQLSDDIAPSIYVRGDKALLTQLFANLIENAIHHSGESSHILIRLSEENGRISMVVADSGPGIPEEEYESILRPFYRLDRSRSTPGCGLGIPLIAAIAQLHEWRLIFGDNRPGLRVTLVPQ